MTSHQHFPPPPTHSEPFETRKISYEMISSSRLSSYPIFSHKTPSIHYSGCLWGRRMKGHKKKITWNVVPSPFTRYVFPHVNHNWEQHESIWLRSESIHRTQWQKSQAEPYFNRTISSHMFYFSFTDDGVFQRWYTLLPPSNSKEGERSLGSENRVTARPASLCIELDRSYFGSAVVLVRPVRRREGWGGPILFSWHQYETWKEEKEPILIIEIGRIRNRNTFYSANLPARPACFNHDVICIDQLVDLFLTGSRL